MEGLVTVLRKKLSIPNGAVIIINVQKVISIRSHQLLPVQRWLYVPGRFSILLALRCRGMETEVVPKFGILDEIYSIKYTKQVFNVI